MIGSPLPLRPWLAPALEVFALSGVRKDGLFPDDPPLVFRSPPESSRPGVALCRRLSSDQDILPCGFFPYSVFPEKGSHIHPRGSTPWVKVPPQRFSRSRGFDPPISCRPCLVPVPLLGFLPFEVAPRPEPYVLSNAVTLLLLSRARIVLVEPASGSCSPDGSLSRSVSTDADNDLHRLSASLSYPPAFPGAASAQLSWTSLGRTKVGPISCPSEYTGRAVGWTLSSLPHSSRFCHLVVNSWSGGSSS